MGTLSNIFWLGTKEVRSLLRDFVMIALIVWAFGPGLLAVNNASIAFVDEDHSALSRSLMGALTPPYFQEPVLIEPDELDRAIDQSRFTFVVVVPPNFEADVRRGLQPEIQLNVDATAVIQAATGTAYVQEMLMDQIAYFAQRSDPVAVSAVDLVVRRAFNPNGIQPDLHSDDCADRGCTPARARARHHRASSRHAADVFRDSDVEGAGERSGHHVRIRDLIDIHR